MTEQVQLHTILEARYNNDLLTAAITADGLRPARPPPSPSIGAATDAKSSGIAAALGAAADLATQCWDNEPTARPKCAEAEAALRAGLAVVMAATLGPKATRSDVRLLEPLPTGGDEMDVEETPPTPGVATAAATAATGGAQSGAPALSDLLGTMDEIARLAGVAGQSSARVGWEATAGRRGADRMEDRQILCARGGITLGAVFDGHNGDACSEYCRVSLPSLLLQHYSRLVGEGKPADDDTTVGDAWRSTFHALHDGFLRSPAADESGCTALATLCTPSRVWIANAGDCQCHLWRGDTLVQLTEEHTALLPTERERVEAAGAEVSTTTDGKLRVGGIIQVTRCIGDRPLRHLGLTSEPQLHSLEITKDDKALIMASDGLWDVMSSERVLHCCKNTAKSPDMFAKRLLTEALDRGTDDNTTVVVIFLQDL